MKLTKEQKEFLKGLHFAKLATLNKSDSPHLTPVWYMYDGSKLVINTARDRQKFLNMRRDDRVALLVDEGYRYVSVFGRAREAKERNANKDIEALAIAYTGEQKGRKVSRERFWKQARVSFEILPERVTSAL